VLQSVDELGMEDHNLQDSLAAPITKMAVSPDGRHVIIDLCFPFLQLDQSTYL
jgi:hypothetical protein